MQSYRITSALPRACRPLAAPARTLSTHFPSFPSSDFAPLWRLLDDSLHQQTATGPQRNATRVFTPRFDVREAANSYELHGELPGIRQEDLDIQFVDPHTLVIKGRTETELSRGTPAETKNAASTAAAPAESSTEHAPQPSLPSYHKATVEDDYVDAGASSSASAPPTPTSSSGATEVAQAPAPASKDAVSKKAEPEYKYWVSERSIGEFTRTFQFPGTVDQEAVKASLKNGILRVVVPKLVRAERRIVVE